ncbi:RICIN domain-containing protein [Plantactinospora sp. B6F1]|uniref:RICIN domain-containing protein n=1 Tax=Plantactinospora sp. B6F1 TaxID=3158971 RepID=UPI0032D8C894
MRSRLIRVVALLVVVVASAGWPLPRPAGASVLRGIPLDPGSAWYPRTIRLEHAPAPYRGRILVSTNTGAGGTFFESTDDGATFRRIGGLAVSRGPGEFSCCSTLFEFPERLGDYPEGTLIWATSVNTFGGGDTVPNPDARIVAWRSTDHGRSWLALPGPIVTGGSGHGLWEPEFSVVGGDLVVHFSDKTQQPRYGQTLARARSADGGDTWSAKVNTVAVDASPDLAAEDSPGMPVVRRLPDGRYLMAYEYCNIRPVPGGHGCRVHYRVSADGWDWGDQTHRGTIAKTVDGRHLAHAPTIAWAPGGGPNGRLLMIARLVRTGADTGPATVLKGPSGTTVLVNDENGVGAWYEIDAPVGIGDFRDESLSGAERDLVLACQNYSSALLPSGDGTRLLEVATDVLDGTCKAFYATGAVAPPGGPAGVPANTTYRLVNLKSRACLDVVAGRVADGSRVQQWSCDTGVLVQRWRASSSRPGLFSFVNAKSGRCLDVPNGNISVDDGDVTQIWTCNGTGAQNWRLSAVGRSTYTISPQNNPDLCLAAAGGSTANGAAATLVPCASGSARLWFLSPTS